MNVTEQSGIHFERFDDIRGLHRIHESTGGGVGLVDYDGDGLLDVVLTNGCRLPLNERGSAHASQLYRNLGGNRFTRVTDQGQFSCVGYSQGVARGDFDNDGFEDLYIAAYGRNWLWQNNGDGTFTDVTLPTGADDPRWSTSAAWGDFNQDGWLDLFVVNYIDAADDPPQLCPREGSPDGYIQCAPTQFAAVQDRLLINDGTGRFRDFTAESGIDGIDGKGLSAVVFDANSDGHADIFVANDGTPNFLYMNEPEDTQNKGDSPRFREEGSKLGVALNREGKAEACMGIACGDYDGDGFMDLFVTNFFAETNTMYRNIGARGFTDSTNRTRLGPPSRLLLGFGTEFLDFDNNGWLDLVVANGHIDDFSWSNAEEVYRMPPLFFRNEGNGTFQDVSLWAGAYFEKKWLGRGLAVGDLDNDCDQDFVVSHQLAESAVLINESADQDAGAIIHFIGRRSNRSAVGVQVEAAMPDRKLVREVVGGGSFQSSSDRRVHLGLGKESVIPNLTVRWPSGAVDHWQNVQAGLHIAIEGQGIFKGIPATVEEPSE